MNFLTIAKTVLSLLPLIIQTINELEKAFPVSGAGAQKLDVLKTIMQSSYDISEDGKDGKFDNLWPAVVKIVSSLVSLKNKTGS